VFQVTPEEKLNSNFRKAWINSFFVLIYFSSLMLLWFPTVFQSDFFSNPLPTLTIVIVTSLIFATLLANSAMQSSRSIIFAQKAIYFLKKKK
jgi:predicted ABC-type exoprotein transport system permease subunit